MSALNININLYQREGDNQADATYTVITDDADIEVYVNGLDCNNLIQKYVVALWVSSIYDQLLACNNEYINVCGPKREALEAFGVLINEKILRSNS